MQRISPEEVKQIELDILLEFDRICKTSGLTYLLFFGTALGAARHRGFIPWDDDIDVVMPRDDYEKFYELFSSGNVSTRYKLVSYRDGTSTYNFFKLIDCRTVVVETYMQSQYPIGIWIDIFPIERVRRGEDYSSTWRACRRKLLIKFQSVADPSKGTTSAARLVKRIVCPLAQLFDPVKLASAIDKKAMSINQGNNADFSASDWVSIDAVSLDKACYPGEFLFPSKTVEFEGHPFPAPSNMDSYLKFEYGNWRELPPENLRRGHFPEAYWRDPDR